MANVTNVDSFYTKLPQLCSTQLNCMQAKYLDIDMHLNHKIWWSVVNDAIYLHLNQPKENLMTFRCTNQSQLNRIHAIPFVIATDCAKPFVGTCNVAKLIAILIAVPLLNSHLFIRWLSITLHRQSDASGKSWPFNFEEIVCYHGCTQVLFFMKMASSQFKKYISLIWTMIRVGH